jgi:hypothetical protein
MITFIRRCEFCLEMLRFKSLEETVVCKCGVNARLQKGRSEDDQLPLNFNEPYHVGPRLDL